MLKISFSYRLSCRSRCIPWAIRMHPEHRCMVYQNMIMISLVIVHSTRMVAVHDFSFTLISDDHATWCIVSAIVIRNMQKSGLRCRPFSDGYLTRIMRSGYHALNRYSGPGAWERSERIRISRGITGKSFASVPMRPRDISFQE